MGSAQRLNRKEKQRREKNVNILKSRVLERINEKREERKEL